MLWGCTQLSRPKQAPIRALVNESELGYTSRMRRFNNEALARIKTHVQKVESASNLEVVIRVVESSGSYRDVRYLCGAIVALSALLVILFSPLVIAPLWVVPLVLTGGLLGGLWGDTRWAIRLFTGRKRRDTQSLAATQASFYEEGVSATREGTGLLLFCSLLEDRIELLVDHPLEGHAPGAEWGAVARIGRQDKTNILERLNQMLDALATLGAQRVPATGDNPNELPDEVRLG